MSRRGTRVFGHRGILAGVLGSAGLMAASSAFFAVSAFSGWATVTPESDRTGTGLLMVAFGVVCGAFMYVAWRRSYVTVTHEGVRSGWFRSQLVRWDEIVSIGLNPDGPMANVLSATTLSGERKNLLNIPPAPFSMWFGYGGHLRRVDVAIARIEAAKPR